MPAWLVPIVARAPAASLHALLPWPFVWWLGLSGALLAWIARRARRRAVRVAAAPLAVLSLALAAAEAALELDPYVLQVARFEGSYADNEFWTPHPVLGYGPRPGAVIRARRLVRGEEVYDVTYTYDRHGQRIRPPLAPSGADGALLVFGGSFALGEGVRDDETFAYRAGVRSEGTADAYNFGFHGYGPHQMLAALEDGWVAEVIESEPRLAVYLAIPDHVVRAAGRKSWDTVGPWYRLEEGRLVRAGHFTDRPWHALGGRVLADRLLGDSRLYRRLRRDPVASRAEDVDLFVALVAAAREEFEARFPGARFLVIGWDLVPAPEGWLERLEDAGIEVHRASRLFPDASAALIPGDLHPSAATHDALAAFVAARWPRSPRSPR